MTADCFDRARKALSEYKTALDANDLVQMRAHYEAMKALKVELEQAMKALRGMKVDLEKAMKALKANFKNGLRTCPNCGKKFKPNGIQQYCTLSCGKKHWFSDPEHRAQHGAHVRKGMREYWRKYRARRAAMIAAERKQ